MKVINLDKVWTDTFYLWEQKLQYTYTEEDKNYFWEQVKNLDLKNIEKELIEIFTYLLSRENIDFEITKQDLPGLWNYFLSKFL